MPRSASKVPYRMDKPVARITDPADVPPAPPGRITGEVVMATPNEPAQRSASAPQQMLNVRPEPQARAPAAPTDRNNSPFSNRTLCSTGVTRDTQMPVAVRALPGRAVEVLPVSPRAPLQVRPPRPGLEVLNTRVAVRDLDREVDQDSWKSAHPLSGKRHV